MSHRLPSLWSSNYFAISISQAHLQSKRQNHWKQSKIRFSFHQLWSQMQKNPVWLFIVNWLRFADNPLHHEQQAVAVQPWIMFPANYLQILTRHNYSNCMNATIKYTHVHAYIHIAHTHIHTSTVSNVSNGDCLGWPRRSQIWLSPTNLLPFVSSHTEWPVVGASLSLSPPAPICKGAARAVLSKGYCPFRSISMDFVKVPFLTVLS